MGYETEKVMKQPKKNIWVALKYRLRTVMDGTAVIFIFRLASHVNAAKHNALTASVVAWYC